MAGTPTCTVTASFDRNRPLPTNGDGTETPTGRNQVSLRSEGTFPPPEFDPYMTKCQECEGFGFGNAGEHWLPIAVEDLSAGDRMARTVEHLNAMSWMVSEKSASAPPP